MDTDTGWQTSPDGYIHRPCARDGCPQFVYKPATGRPGRFCSESCRQIDYQSRRRSQDRLDAHDARIRELTNSVRFTLELCEMKPASKRNEAADAIVRTLFLNNLIS